ncbi:MAG: hypothetical protein A2086_17370 [Spirochaetes bacterium GWD1_27_9]|nr:MAG: hypothetical protein A2Y34_07580 [Spirochaetes bacterium GWC1_27_15]OHD42991.1 MAG: hypothetical protein A2086_17370 [Spirochaetes bacterium GWD1_27_9]
MKKFLFLIMSFAIITNLFSKDITRCGFSFWLPDDMVSKSTDYTDNQKWIMDSNKEKDFFVLHLPMTKYTDNGYISLNAFQSLIYLLENGFDNYFHKFILSEVKNTNNNSLNNMKIDGNALYYQDSTIGDTSSPISVKIFGVFQERNDTEIKTFGLLIIVNDKKIKDYSYLINKILTSLKYEKK